MKDLLIHIGLHKTGTSAIQAFLRENRARLAQQGILVPLDIQEWGNHNPLIWHLLEARYLPVNGSYYAKESTDAHWATLRRVIEASDAPRALLSGEDFCLVDPARLAELCSGFNTRILVYLRRQDQYLQSIHNEDVKSFGFMRQEGFDAFLERNRLDEIVDYDRFLRRWMEAFGEDRVEVGIYDKTRLPEGLIPDFAARAGIRMDEGFKPPPREINVSLPADLLEIKRILNRFPLSEAQHRILLDALLAMSPRSGQPRTAFGDHPFLTRERRQAFLEPFREGNQAVARHLFGEGASLFPDPEEEPAFTGAPAPALPDSLTLLTQWIGPLLQDLTSSLDEARKPSGPQNLPEADLPEADATVQEPNPLQVPFRKDAMTPASAALFNLPPTAQDGDNLYSMVNWAPLYLPLLDAVGPRTIVEIGSELGGNTSCLGRYCLERGIQLHVVDTHPNPDPQFAHSDRIHYHKARSADFLEGFSGAEVYFIDGDHNYPTVTEELQRIARCPTGGRPLLLLMHDTGWPCGITDCFYDPASTGGDLPPLTTSGGPLPWKTTMNAYGFGSGHFAFPMQAGGEKNGVRAAIDDFIAGTPGWRKVYFTPFYGLCMLWKEDSFPAPLTDYLQELIATLERVEPLSATLEWNRILLYIQTQFMGEEWKRQRDWIAHLEAALKTAGIPY